SNVAAGEGAVVVEVVGTGRCVLRAGSMQGDVRDEAMVDRRGHVRAVLPTRQDVEGCGVRAPSAATAIPADFAQAVAAAVGTGAGAADHENLGVVVRVGIRLKRSA